MNRYFAIYHNLTPAAPWGVALERSQGTPKVELLLLCRSEQDAIDQAKLNGLGDELKKSATGKATENSNER